MGSLARSLILIFLATACGEGFHTPSEPPAVQKLPPPTGDDTRLPQDQPTHSPEPSPSPSPIPANIRVCTSLLPYSNMQNDASAEIQRCIDETPENHILEIPAGIYTIERQIRIRTQITIRTQEKNDSMSRCLETDGHDCAEIRASPDYFEALGLIRLEGSSRATLDHLVINGNKEARQFSRAADECRAGQTNHYGFNILMDCSNCKITNSVSKNALCGTSIQVTNRSYVTISGNAVLKNGIHNAGFMWADGITVGSAEKSIIADNEISDNTDVDLIFGGCRDCRVERNRITHSPDFESSAFAAFMLYQWPGHSSGDFSGSTFSTNYIDCGPFKRCGFGLYIGVDAWAVQPQAQIFGGSVHDNSIRNAQHGFAVDHTTGIMEIYNNQVESSGGQFKTGCGMRTMSHYSVDRESILDRTRDQTPTSSYKIINWDGCIPNWWQ